MSVAGVRVVEFGTDVRSGLVNVVLLSSLRIMLLARYTEITDCAFIVSQLPF